MSKKAKILLVIIAVVVVLLLFRKKEKLAAITTTSAGRTDGGGTGSSGGSSSSSGSMSQTPTTGFIITGIGQTVTGRTPTLSVTAPARVINLTAYPSGSYNVLVRLKTAAGTLLHTENVTGLEITSSGYPAIYFNPTNPAWGIVQAGTYTFEIEIIINGTTYTKTTTTVVTSEDLGIGGSSGISLSDYTIQNDLQAVLSLTGGTNGQSTTIQLRQGGNTVGTLNAPYAATMTVQSSAYGYVDVFIDNTDIGSIYIPNRIAGNNWTVEKSKAVSETGTLDLQFGKVGSQFVVTDAASNSGWANVEYWHNKTFLGASIPNNYYVEPNVEHHFTKKRWGAGGNWISYNEDPNPKAKAQLTFKIVPL